MCYYAYSDFLKEKYGEKVYKLPINIETTCPNRDGTKGFDGCVFCGEIGTGFENLSSHLTVGEQLEKNMAHIGSRYGAEKFIAYFQNFTNTYLPLEKLIQYTEEAMTFEGVVEVCYSTRPDCIPEDYLKALKELAKERNKTISFEIGLQSVNNETLKIINRQHTVEEFIDAVRLVKQYGFEVCAHLILNLPWDSMEHAIQSAKLMNQLNIDSVKLHSLYIETGTILADWYRSGKITVPSKEDYLEKALLFLTHLNAHISVQRLFSRAPQDKTLFCNWETSWWKLKDELVELMEDRCAFQGRDTPPKLILWDIDGTLMHCGSLGSQALNETFKTLYDIEDAFRSVEIGTALDSEFMDFIMKKYTIKDEKAVIINKYVAILKTLLKEDTKKSVLPGILEILNLDIPWGETGEQGIYHSLLTSNFKAGARVKLEALGLDSYFKTGGYGDIEGTKIECAHVSISQAEDFYGVSFNPEDIYVVGDSASDIMAAKGIGATSISVLTGWMSKEALEPYEPDYILKDLSCLQDFLGIIYK